MPQTSDEMRALMQEWFGDEVSDEGPTRLLLSRGWSERGGMWQPPTSAYFNDVDWLCLRFLVEEWDHDLHRATIHSYLRKHTGVKL